MCLLADFLSFSQGLLTPVIAIITVYIAYQQWQTTEKKLKLDLYNKRFHVYKEVGKAIRAFLCNQDAEIFGGLRRATLEVDFLFGPEISGYVDEICKRGSNYLTLKNKLRETEYPQNGDLQKEKDRNSMSLELPWFASHIDDPKILNQKFDKYLNLNEHSKIKRALSLMKRWSYLPVQKLWSTVRSITPR